MAIKRQDGTIYTLRGPNPLMKAQDHWDPAGLVFHNMHWEPLILPDLARPVQAMARNLRPDMPPAPPPAPPPPVAQHQAAPPPKAAEPDEPDEPKGMVRCHCLPLHQRRIKDELYDRDFTTGQYGYPFQFTVGPVRVDDLVSVFWTAREGITEGSVLFPRMGEARWWRVTRSERHGVGHLLTCEPSDYQPSFD